MGNRTESLAKAARDRMSEIVPTALCDTPKGKVAITKLQHVGGDKHRMQKYKARFFVPVKKGVTDEITCDVYAENKEEALLYIATVGKIIGALSSDEYEEHFAKDAKHKKWYHKLNPWKAVKPDSFREGPKLINIEWLRTDDGDLEAKSTEGIEGRCGISQKSLRDIHFVAHVSLNQIKDNVTIIEANQARIDHAKERLERRKRQVKKLKRKLETLKEQLAQKKTALEAEADPTKTDQLNRDIKIIERRIENLEAWVPTKDPDNAILKMAYKGWCSLREKFGDKTIDGLEDEIDTTIARLTDLEERLRGKDTPEIIIARDRLGALNTQRRDLQNRLLAEGVTPAQRSTIQALLSAIEDERDVIEVTLQSFEDSLKPEIDEFEEIEEYLMKTLSKVMESYHDIPAVEEIPDTPAATTPATTRTAAAATRAMPPAPPLMRTPPTVPGVPSRTATGLTPEEAARESAYARHDEMSAPMV
jgi:hypothetical protein